MDDGHQQCASRRKGTLPNRTGKNSGKKPCKQSIEGSQGISFSSLSQIPLAQKLIIVTSALLLVFCLVPRVAQLSGTTGQPVSLHARSAKSDVREWRRRDDEPQRLYESGRHGRKEAAREPWDAAGIWDDDGAGPYEGGEMVRQG